MSAKGLVPLGPDAGAHHWVHEPDWVAWRSALRRVLGVVMVLLSVVPLVGFLAVRWLIRRQHPAAMWALVLAADGFIASIWLVASVVQ